MSAHPDDLTLAIPLPRFRARAGLASVTPESSLMTALQGLIDKLTAVWWRLESLLERWKMGMREHRIDPDFNPNDEMARLLRQAIEQLLLAKPGGNSYNNGGGDNHRILNWILTIVGALAVSAIVGGIAFYGKVTALEERVSGMMAAHEARITRLENINERRYREPQ